MSKELFMIAHEQCVEEYMAEHPDADWSEAYEATADAAGKRYIDNVADMIDSARDREKYQRHITHEKPTDERSGE